MFKLSGIYAPLTTPFDAGGALALERLRENLERYAGAPLAGYVILGSTGEAILLDRDEKLAVLRAAAASSALRGRLLIAGTGEESLAATLAMTRAAADLGYALALVRTPHYYKRSMTAAALRQFYLQLAEASPLPILIYNFPQLTGIDLDVETAAELAAHPRVAGIKESSGSLEKIERLLALADPSAGREFHVLPGNAATLYPSLAVGVEAAILALADGAPELCAALWQASRHSPPRALRLQNAAMPLSLAASQLGIPAIKALMDLAGYYGGPVRSPLLPLAAAQLLALRAAHERAREALALPASA